MIQRGLCLDDPLLGFEIRRKKENVEYSKDEELVGFITSTNFQQNQSFFFFDTVPAQDEARSKFSASPELVQQLNDSYTHGDPFTGGFRWNEIAEVSVLSALGCGRMLVELLICEIRRSQQAHHQRLLQHHHLCAQAEAARRAAAHDTVGEPLRAAHGCQDPRTCAPALIVPTSGEVISALARTVAPRLPATRILRGYSFMAHNGPCQSSCLLRRN